jgi:hypothetical protein
MRLTIAERAAVYNRSFPQFPASHLHVVQEQGRDVLYGLWLLGNDYRTSSTLYGSYPKGYLERVGALFPDVHQPPLHIFSGSLPASPDYIRVDVHPGRRPDICASVYDLEGVFAERDLAKRWLVFGDPPYSEEDAIEYGTAMVDRRRALAAIATITRPGGHLVWLDTVWPMHRKENWLTVGRLFVDELVEGDQGTSAPDDLTTVARIGLVRSTNHRVRLISIFERQAA